MSKITTDFVGNESLATTKSRLTSILEYWGYTPSLYTNWGGARTDMNSLLGSTAVAIIGATELAGTFLPKINFLNDTDAVIINALFSALEIGFIQDFSDPDTLYTDAAGAVLLTAPGQTIGLVADKSRVRSPITSYAGVQASAGLRPTYGRAPKSRRNLLTQTEFANGVTDAQTRGGLLGAVSGVDFGVFTGTGLSFGYDGTTLTYAYKNSTPVNGTYTFSVYVVMDSGGPPAFGSAIASNVANDFALYVGTTTPSPLTYVVEPVGGNIYRVSCTAILVSPTGFGVIKYITNSARTFSVSAYQNELSTAVTPYQKVTTAFDMTEAGVNSYGYTRLDRADDKLTVTLPSSITGDLMLFGRNGSWLEAGVTLPSGAFDLGPTGTVRTPGILSALGDLVGDVVIARTTSTEERDLAKRYFAGRGAAGWLETGAELLTNGGFADGTGWTNTSTGTGTAVISGGQATLTGVDASNRGALLLTTDVTGITIGQPYMIQWQIMSGTANSQVVVNSGGVVVDRFGATVAETRRAVFIAGATTIGFSFNVYGAGTVVFDNFSIKPLTVGA